MSKMSKMSKMNEVNEAHEVSRVNVVNRMSRLELIDINKCNEITPLNIDVGFINNTDCKINYEYLFDRSRTVDDLNEELFWDFIRTTSIYKCFKYDRSGIGSCVIELSQIFKEFTMCGGNTGPIVYFYHKILNFITCKEHWSYIFLSNNSKDNDENSDHKKKVYAILYCIFKGKKYFYKIVNYLMSHTHKVSE